MDRLLEDHEASLVLLAAPAGYGKTSVLSEWAEIDERPFAWLTLRDSDNDPCRLLASLALAVDQLSAGDRGPRAAMLPPSEAAILAGLIGALGAPRAGAVLVLDDVQLVSSLGSLAVLGQLANAMPSGTKLALASRTPPLAVARLRAQHDLLAFGVEDLAMTVEEADSLLTAAGLHLTSEQLQFALLRTEGWPAALYLVALALHDETDPGAALQRFAGDDEIVSQYIREELLATMPPGELAFLTESAIFNELTAELCDGVLGRTGSGLVLRAAAASNLLVSPRDRPHTRYRCHPLLREALRAELARLDADRPRRLHRAAARWFEEHHEPEQALDHALDGGELAHVGRLLWSLAPRTLLQGRATGFHTALRRLSAQQIESEPTLALSAAHCELFKGDLRGAVHWARAASRGRSSDLESAIPDFAAGLAVIEAAVGPDSLTSMSEAATRAYELADERSAWRPACCLLRGVSDHLIGQHVHAREMLNEGAQRGAIASPGVQSYCLSQLAVMAGEDCDWEAAADLNASALTALEGAGLRDRPASSLVLAGAAWICAKRGHADEAKGHLERSLRMLGMLRDFIPLYEVETRVLLARASIRLVDLVLARSQLAHASRLARRAPDIAAFRRWFDEAWGEVDELSATALGDACSLTMAELRVLRFLPTHLSFREIGGRLHVSTNTVKSQVHAVYRKLDAASRSEAVEHASSLGLIDACV